MSTDVINGAGIATRNVKLALERMRVRLALMDATTNALGILNDRWAILGEMDAIEREINAVRKVILGAHWPTEAEYAEV